MVDSNDHELILRYEDSPVTRDEDWGAFAWGPLPQWEDNRRRLKSPKSNHHSKTGSSAPHNNHPHHYNPRADETDYDDYETPEIGDIHGDEVYNNID
jgi:hypothetical protein